MRSSNKLLSLFLALGLSLSLSACGNQTPAPAETAPLPAATESGNPGSDVPAEELDAAEEPPEEQTITDGLEGRYYNDYLRLTLTLDGGGGCALTGDGVGDSGTYARAEDGALTLDFSTREEQATVDGDGDITIEGRTGYFLRDWEFWGITEAEVGGATAASVGALHTATIDNGDGTFRFRDFENSIAFTYTAGMSVLRDGIVGGVAATDGAGGYVTGRNVTELYATSSGTDDEFLEDYIKAFVFSDFRQLCGNLETYDALTLLHEGIPGRLASALLALKSANGSDFIQAKVLFYTSTYADGTVNYICKTIFGDADTLEAAVTEMSAIRLKAD